MRKVWVLIIGLMMLAACGQQPKKMVLQGLAQGSYYAITYYDAQGRTTHKDATSNMTSTPSSMPWICRSTCGWIVP